MSNSGALAGAVGVVTGGTRGIGRAVAATLLSLGATVVITGRNAASGESGVSELSGLGGACDGVACDVMKLDSVEALGRHLRQKYGRVNILVNNAGIGGRPSPVRGARTGG